MKRLRSSKITASWLFTFTVCLLLVGGAIAVVFWPRQYGSEIYQYYSNIKGIKASYFENYRINDTVFVDITLLEAVDSNGWNTLWQDFCLPDLNPEMKRVIESKGDKVFSRTTKKNSYCDTVDEASPECDIVAVLFAKQTISVFHVTSLEERGAVHHYNYDKSVNNNTILP